MVQVDTHSYKILDFVNLLKQACLREVLICMKSFNLENLKPVNKRQNYKKRLNCGMK